MMGFDHRKFLISLGDKNPKLSKKFATDTDCYMCYVCPENCYVSPPPPAPPPQFSGKYHIPTVLILMLCVLGVAFLVLSYLTLARYRCRNSRSRNPEDLETSRGNFVDENHGPVLDHPIWYIRSVGLPQSAIDSIASFAYRNGLIDGKDCSVCLNEFQENEMLRLLPKCSHAFHLDCIDTWLRSHKNCPVCRAPVVSTDAGLARATSVESSPSSSSSSSGSNEVTTPMPIQFQGGGDHINIDILSKNGCVFEKLRVVSDLQGVRRSVSMDFSMMKNSTSSSLQKGSVSMKRSFSFSGKRSLRKNSKS